MIQASALLEGSCMKGVKCQESRDSGAKTKGDRGNQRRRNAFPLYPLGCNPRFVGRGCLSEDAVSGVSGETRARSEKAPRRESPLQALHGLYSLFDIVRDLWYNTDKAYAEYEYHADSEHKPAKQGRAYI